MQTATVGREFWLPGSGGPCVGEVVAEIELENLVDRELALRGDIDESAVRTARVSAVVDTGAVMLFLPEEVVAQLGLRQLRTVPVTYADNRTEERPVAGVVSVRVAGRDAEVTCVVGPRGSEPLLGQTVLEFTDLLVDCRRRELVPHPDFPEKPHYKIK